MAKRITPFFLPIRRETIGSLIEHSTLPTAPAELAAVMAVALMRKVPGLTVHQVERALMEAQDLILDDPSAAAATIAGHWEALGPVSLQDLEELLATRHLVFAPSKRLPFADEPIERYDSGFQEEMQTPLQTIELDVLPPSDDREATEDDFEDDWYDGVRPERPRFALTGTREQTMSANTVIAMLDEQIDVDAYAGTGKTHLIMTLASSAPGAFTYVTPFWAHMQGGQRAAAHRWSHLRTRTLFELALETARPLAAAHGIGGLRIGDGDAPPEERVRLAGIRPIGRYTDVQVLDIAQRAINSWSETDASAIDARHFKALGRGPVDPGFITAAESIWKVMWAPRHVARPFSMRLSHLMKWLNLRNEAPPVTFGTLLVDEAHDLMPSWRQFLERYRGGCVFLGDPFQRLTGQMPRHGRNKLVAMNQSFRMGQHGEHAVRRTLERAPEQRLFDPFLGSRRHVTRVRHWRGRDESLQDGLRVYANEWSLLEDAQRLKQEGGRYRLLPATARDLRRLVDGAVTLFNQKEQGWRSLAGGYRSWDALAEALVRDGREKVVRLFERGYNLARFDELMAGQAPAGEERITLGLVPHVKNLEASSVALNECCFTDAQARHGHVPAHAVYLAISRVRDELWLPGDAFNRLADLKAPEPQPWDLAPA